MRLRGAAAALGLAAVAASWPVSTQEESRSARPVIWNRAIESTVYRTIPDGSGLVEVDSDYPQDLDTNDLDAVCSARDEAIRRATVRASLTQAPLDFGDDPTVAEDRSTAEFKLGAIATYSGQIDKAIGHLERARDALVPFLEDVPSYRRPYLTLVESLGAAYLRRGEVANCLLMPNADRCLFPVLPRGVHEAKAGSLAAAGELRKFLQVAPGDLEVRWLLNLSYMLAGGYPQDVPAGYLLDPKLFQSEVALPRFSDVGPAAGLGRMDIAGGTIADDFDGDGLMDLVTSSVDHCAPARFYRNRGDGTFEDRTDAAGLARQLGAINAVQTDYDNDGRLDVFLMRGGWEFPIRNSLLHNDGGGRFTDVTREAGLLAGVHATHSVAWGDYDNDGWVDVFIAHELTPAQLFRNRGNGTFEDVTAKSGIEARGLITKGVVFGDYDNDGYPDLYLSNMFAGNMLFHNNRNGTFTEVAKQLGVERPALSFPTWFFDYDNDGWLDIFVASYPNSIEEFLKYYLRQPPVAETLKLYRNNGDGTFADVSASVGLDRVVPAMGSNFGDLDNDGFLDMYLGTGTPSFGALMPNVMLKNQDGARFVDVTGTTGTGQLQKGHGIAFVDLDNDGDEDIVLNNGGAVPGDSYNDSIFENPGAGGDNHWISIHLVGVKSNRAAIGAKIRVTLDRGTSRLRYREVTSGGSFGANSLTQHIGLGAARIASLEIAWPASGTKQVFKDVPIDAFLEIREDARNFTVRTPKRFELNRSAAEPHEH